MPSTPPRRERHYGSVSSAKVDELRLTLASAGIPKSGRIGFEIFDKANFGATDFTEHVNFRRALEGELERSIKTLSEVADARVHVTFPKDSVFIESRQPAKASVILGLRRGANVTAANVTAVRYLVASAVEGLAPESVSVMDSRGNSSAAPAAPSAATPSSPKPPSSTSRRSRKN